MFILFIFLLFTVGGYFVGSTIASWIDNSKKESSKFVDNSQHTHFHVHSGEKSKEIEELTNYIDVTKK